MGGAGRRHAQAGQRMSSTGARSNDALVVASEVLLAAVTLAGVVSFARLFVGNEWVGPLVTAAVADARR